MDLTCQNIHYAVSQKEILKGISLTIEGNHFHTILVPNGSGKLVFSKTSTAISNLTAGTFI